ncbi:DUF305 domain-containing protein [Nocardioides sp.]|uniref:DUF305 domain-containing protein n=1 Tax=Nocardioides sp. TaxID=35761 RepID=UPI0035B109F4
MSAPTHARARRATAAALLTTLAPALTACGGGDESDEPAARQTAANGDVYNAADVEFATEMIPHHADALVMVDMTQGRDLSPEMVELTEAVRAAQAPEIETMVDWLTAWGEEVPETSRDHANSHDMDGMEGGMGMDPDDLAALEDAEGSAFESMWLDMMVEHHEGAIDMARVEQADGAFPDAVALAESIEESQTAEIEHMKEMAAG